MVERAGQLSKSRHELAVVLEDIIRQELQDLYMEKARFQVRFTKGKFNREGNETVEFTSLPTLAKTSSHWLR